MRCPISAARRRGLRQRLPCARLESEPTTAAAAASAIIDTTLSRAATLASASDERQIDQEHAADDRGNGKPLGPRAS